jgi:Methyltransferase domain
MTLYIYNAHNPIGTMKPRTVFSGIERVPVVIAPGDTRQVKVHQHTAMMLARRDGLVFTFIDDSKPVANGKAGTAVSVAPGKPQITIRAMLGKGDNIHVRAPVKEYMRRGYQVHLQTPSLWMFHDLIAQGLKCYLRETNLHAQKRQLDRERSRFTREEPPAHVTVRKIGYNYPEIERHGNIARAVFDTAGLEPPTGPVDFSLPVPMPWRLQAKKLIATWDLKDKPLLVYRPVTLRREWDGSQRNCDPTAYAAIFGSIRERFHVVSIADLVPGVEWIIGDEQDADVKLHHGELDDETMVGLFAEADLVMSPAGFAPVLSQAVAGTPVVIVYGRRESYKTTDIGGAHLAPTLGIDPDVTCDCHSRAHQCTKCKPIHSPEKHITLEPAIARLKDFVDQHAGKRKDTTISQPRILIFGTSYVDNQDRANLANYWIELNQKLNPDCDLLVVDTPCATFKMEWPAAPNLSIFSFSDNIGHLSRKGRDGWGRAFTKGLQLAVEQGYDYVVHVEADSLLRLPVRPVVQQMAEEGTAAVSTPVKHHGRDLPEWAETGLMFFSVKYVRDSKLISKYDWERRTVSPTPEIVVRRLLASSLKMMPWKALRANKHHDINSRNLSTWDLDWITHTHSDVACYRMFFEAAMGINTLKEVMPAEPVIRHTTSDAKPTVSVGGGLKINLGCGTNKLNGWENHDADVDITKSLPWTDGCAAFILCEHCVEHISDRQAIGFLHECLRVLAPGGIVRIAVPSIERIWKSADESYFRFTQRWQDIGPTARGAMHAIIYAHGHEAIWTTSKLEAVMYYCGFDQITSCQPGMSSYRELCGIEGHGKVIGDRFNDLETIVCEGTKL